MFIEWCFFKFLKLFVLVFWIKVLLNFVEFVIKGIFVSDLVEGLIGEEKKFDWLI